MWTSTPIELLWLSDRAIRELTMLGLDTIEKIQYINWTGMDRSVQTYNELVEKLQDRWITL